MNQGARAAGSPPSTSASATPSSAATAPQPITALTIETRPTTVYNFQVANLHTYAVSKDGVLVHNTKVGCDPPTPKSGTLSNVEARQWYLDQEAKILSEIDPNLPLRERALQAFQRRNELRTQARELMADRELAAKLMRDEPNLTLQDIVRRKYQQKGLTGDALWQDILDSWQKSRTSVNQKLGLE